ncbi:MAG: PAS domain-containing protein, partial [Pyrinomonadaceae bacterium]
YTVDEWLSTPSFWLTIVHPDDRNEAGARAAAVFEDGRGRGSQEFRWIAKDGRIVWVQSNSAVTTDQDGKPVGMCGVNFEITESKLAAQKII